MLNSKQRDLLFQTVVILGLILAITGFAASGRPLANPPIFNVVATNVTATTTTIHWSTTKPADSQVAYFIGAAKPTWSKCCSPSNTTSHSVTLTGLAPNTAYNFFVESMPTGSSTPIDSAKSTFHTASSLSFSNVAATNITATTATITWTTSKPADTQVAYFVGSAKPTWSKCCNPVNATSHSLTLTGLTPNTSYNFFVESTPTGSSTPVDSAASAFHTAPSNTLTVNVSAKTAKIATGGVTSYFSATVQNDSQNKGVSWTLSGSTCSGAACGTVSPTSSASGQVVTYTSPAKASAAGPVSLTATSLSVHSVSSASTITLAAPPAPTPSTPLVLGHAEVPQGYGEPVIATDAAGNVDVAWVDGNGPEFVRSTNGGIAFSAPLIIPSALGFTLNAQNGIQMGLDEAGHINLLWHRDLTPSSIIPNSFFSRSTDGGVTFSTPVNPGGATSAQLVVAPNGNVTIIWFDQTTSDLLAVSSTDGVNFSSPITVWTAVGNPMDLTVATGSQGQIYLFWTQVVTMTNCSILASSSANGVTFSPASTISAQAGSCNQTPTALVDSNGNVIVAWDADGASVFFSSSTNSGATFSAPLSIPTAAKPMSPQVTVSPDGTIYIVWETGSGQSFARSVDGGATFSPTPPTFVLGQAAVVDSCDNVTVLGTGAEIRATYQRSTDGGVTFAAPVIVSDLNFNYEEQITIDKSGNVHMTWGVDGPALIEYVRLPTTCSIP
jgi:Fibronectin type III domain